MAKNMAYRVTMRDRQFGYDLPAIICFEYTENLELNYKKFADENLEWAKFVIANRVPIEIALKLGFPENNVDQKYDIVIGSTADGCVANIASNLRYGKILPENYKLDIADFLKEDGSTYGMQIVFCTPKSLSCIKYVKCDILDKRGDIHEKKGKRI